ncbi:hypothetical protein FRX31_017919 [Thalictrum thalictroides]|uniref:Reverse transcriptase zinc-binding domain-containing protein n=1 Tax=Thalictrum thalictroides TaxID=46969 RepID=A0A7J6W545_THATH|nr:hypothetical protein FRX31_017919 [Thalictrum thalictroides]
MNSRELAGEIWAVLPYAVIWTTWKIRNEVLFDNGTAVASKAVRRIKSVVWNWMNMSLKVMDLREQFKLTDLLQGWRYVMVEQCNEVAADLWEALPYAVLWIVWRTRNEVIYENDKAVPGKEQVKVWGGEAVLWCY